MHYIWPVTYIHHDQTVATTFTHGCVVDTITIRSTSSNVTRGSYTRGSLGFGAHRLSDDLAVAIARCKALYEAIAYSRTLAGSGPSHVGLRPSRGVSRRVERPPEWTDGGEW